MSKIQNIPQSAFIPAAQGQIMFMNPFTGAMEPFFSEGEACKRMFEAAAARINALEAEVERIKAHLVLD